MKARVRQLFEDFRHEFANFSLPCEGPLSYIIIFDYQRLQLLPAWQASEGEGNGKDELVKHEKIAGGSR